MIKKVSSTVLLALIAEAYKHDPEGLLSDLQIIVDNEETLVEFAQQAIEVIEMEDPLELIQYEEELERVPALLANK